LLFAGCAIDASTLSRLVPLRAPNESSNMKNYLYPILLQYGGGRPALVFCASRREAEDSAAKARIPPRCDAMHFRLFSPADAFFSPCAAPFPPGG
jgi:hypothetical protein